MFSKVLSRHLCCDSRQRPRVVVTGMGVVTCLGLGLESVWEKLTAGKSGIQRLTADEYKTLPCQIAGVVPKGKGNDRLDMDANFTASEQRTLSLATCYALVAAKEAISQSNWTPSTERERADTGVAIGMGMVPLEEIVTTGRALSDKGYKKVSPYFIPKILINMAAGNVSLRYGFKGVNHAVSTACTTGAHAIGDAASFIQRGVAKVMICGGTEASVDPLSIAGFARMRALSTNFNDDPQLASRPFDKDRDGFVMSEGAGILVLENLEHALGRGADIYAEILGYGVSGDAYHITAPSETGDGAYRCMKAALQDASLKPNDIGHINAHATSTPLGDKAECWAVRRLFGDHTNSVVVSSTKGSVGHLLGAAGCVEAIFTIMACHTGVIPPTLNCYEPDPEIDLNLARLEQKSWSAENNTKRVALTNSFGFGGTNASLCVSNWLD